MSSDSDTIISWYTNRNPMDWFRSPPGFDDEIRSRFGALTLQARTGALDAWADTPRGALALVVLLDQFPRNMFRDSAEAFASDAQALRIATGSIARGFDVLLGAENRLFQMLLYMPLMHAEDLLAQVACRALFGGLVRVCREEGALERFMELGAGAAERHLVCIQALGRFPKRNAALDRPMREEEVEWLEKHPGGF
ncbi:hypothetical protein C8A05DRAFT_19835 [Staphylotrichum tortipilum]|uniref:DUF924 domain-containing protein n=1 Tax=Staphylotrichum tortipilum TaxID=2831512 RepID=A0AAN6MC22_9PEZI|nr:hypothetical protein C8A05DRAFT_19835 [Staphylotrichum longicolle]